jgi:hypothetical protein
MLCFEVHELFWKNILFSCFFRTCIHLIFRQFTLSPECSNFMFGHTVLEYVLTSFTSSHCMGIATYGLLLLQGRIQLFEKGGGVQFSEKDRSIFFSESVEMHILHNIPIEANTVCASVCMCFRMKYVFSWQSHD